MSPRARQSSNIPYNELYFNFLERKLLMLEGSVQSMVLSSLIFKKLDDKVSVIVHYFLRNALKCLMTNSKLPSFRIFRSDKLNKSYVSITRTKTTSIYYPQSNKTLNLIRIRMIQYTHISLIKTAVTNLSIIT